jgi:predicted  nucleic acid-binding Zn-ribbon protein
MANGEVTLEFISRQILASRHSVAEDLSKINHRIDMLTAAINDMAAIHATSGEIRTVHEELGELRTEMHELRARVHELTDNEQ